MPTLRLTGPDQLFIINQEPTTYSEQIGRWTVREELDRPGTEHGQPELRRYRVVMESQPTDRDEIRRLFETAVPIAESLERLWLYATAWPLSGRRFVMSLVPVSLPKGWRENKKDVELEFLRLSGGGIYGDVSITSRDWATVPVLPLRDALRAHAAFPSLPEEFKVLAELHYEAHITGRDLSMELGFARALELARALIPGRNDRARQSALDPQIQAALTQPLSWLYDMSHNRLSTRHVVSSGPRPVLLARMSSAEHRDFVHNADLVLRGLMCGHLGIPLRIAR